VCVSSRGVVPISRGGSPPIIGTGPALPTTPIDVCGLRGAAAARMAALAAAGHEGVGSQVIKSPAPRFPGSGSQVSLRVSGSQVPRFPDGGCSQGLRCMHTAARCQMIRDRCRMIDVDFVNIQLNSLRKKESKKEREKEHDRKQNIYIFMDNPHPVQYDI
jgi:hypothetical protein